LATPSTNEDWLQHWKDKLYEISEVGQEYTVAGANSHKMVSVDFVKDQIEYYEGKVAEETYGLTGQQEIRNV
jgi:hypothetical protein